MEVNVVKGIHITTHFLVFLQEIKTWDAYNLYAEAFNQQKTKTPNTPEICNLYEIYLITIGQIYHQKDHEVEPRQNQ